MTEGRNIKIMRMWTWQELQGLADNIRHIRDNYIEMIPVRLFAILYRNLKIIQQELRILQETDNFIKKAESEDEYLISHETLMNLPVSVNLKTIPLDIFEANTEIPLNIFEGIIDLMEEGNISNENNN